MKGQGNADSQNTVSPIFRVVFEFYLLPLRRSQTEDSSKGLCRDHLEVVVTFRKRFHSGLVVGKGVSDRYIFRVYEESQRLSYVSMTPPVSRVVDPKPTLRRPSLETWGSRTTPQLSPFKSDQKM